MLSERESILKGKKNYILISLYSQYLVYLEHLEDLQVIVVKGFL